MTPTNFPEANTRFKAPVDIDESQCSTIPAYVGILQGGNLDGAGVVITAWQPSVEERMAIAAGETIFLGVMGDGLPPHFLSVGFPGGVA